ncbi:type II toxin-antitoxin system HicB family antitoxin [uncultured Methylobacterium sp.]|uniref:type II toxin-antitoxin system HicB family antitoxin n=1 Tax=uncultured Methylobacterium sp. TaxID=157278 RepID=UPI0035CBE88F
MRYAIVIERVGDGYSAYLPDLPGCIATGATIADVTCAITEAIRVHIAGLQEDGEPVPAPTNLIDPRQGLQTPEGDDPFVTLSEWAGEADEAAYADL